MTKKAEKPPGKEYPEVTPLSRVDHGAATFSFSISADKMKIFAECSLKEANLPVPMTRLQVLGLVPHNIPVRLLHPEVLDDIAAHLSRGRAVERRRIGKGVAPTPGRDGRLVLLIKALSPTAEKTPEFVDPWFVKKFDNVEIGMTVARLYLPHDGNPGIDILGAAIPGGSGAPAAVEVDETLEVQPPKEGQPYSNIVAKARGYLKIDKGKLQVVHDLIVKGDVDLQTGDINFVGKVIIRGSVMKNFRVHARDGIEVHGDVLDGLLSTEAGDITVKGNVTGESLKHVTLGDGASFQQLLRVSTRKPQIICGGVFRAALVSDVSIEALGDIEIEKEARSSYLRTRAILRMPKGQLVGGEVYCVCGVEAAVLGTELHTPTKITLCSDTESSIEYGELIDKLRGAEAAEDMIRLYLGPYAANPSRIALLKPDHKRKMERLRLKLAEVKRTIERIAKEKELLLANGRSNNVFRINVHKIAYPGLDMVAASEHFILDGVLDGPKTIEYVLAEKRFGIFDQQPLECTVGPGAGKK